MFTIGITTFKHRFETYFKPLLHEIKKYDPDIEVIVTINGEHNEPLDETYRKEILSFISEYKNVIPVMYPTFRGLSKLWNTIIIHSSNEFILLLNDDLTVTSPKFISALKLIIPQVDKSFKLNKSWSHVLLKKKEVMTVGFFDERLLGIGEEDGDFEWRYNNKFGRPFLNFGVSGIINHVDMTHAPVNIKAGSSGKYSKFNRDAIFKILYNVNPYFGKAYGMIKEKLVENHREKQYPYEAFYQENKNKI